MYLRLSAALTLLAGLLPVVTLRAIPGREGNPAPQPIPEPLPNYIAVNDPQCKNTEILHKQAQPLKFPLSQEDRQNIDTLVAKFRQEENCAGLAAPQIGIGKQIIVFAVHDDPVLKKWRPDLDQTMPETVLINPSYEGVGTETLLDYEGCFSVHELAGLVKRHVKIHWKAQDQEGRPLEGEATGFLARVIQHEVDHIRGVLFIDRAQSGSILPVQEYRSRRAEAMSGDSN